MLRLPNPGSNIDGIIRIFQELYKALRDRSSFGLDDMTQVLIDQNLATSSGYAGEEALRRSARVDRSRDSLYNQSKAYSEVYKLLGWLHPTPESRLTFVFSFLGAHVAELQSGDQEFMRQCVLGASYPTDVLDVAGGYRIRPFATILRTLSDLGGCLSRDEMIIGPLSLADDRDETAFKAMIDRIQKIRGDFRRLEKAISELGKERSITAITMGNYTRFPLALLPWAGWTTKERRSDIYGRSVVFQQLTPAGESIAAQLDSLIDVRKEDLAAIAPEIQNAMHQLGFYALMGRAGFDLSEAQGVIAEANKMALPYLQEVGADIDTLLYSPFQQVRADLLIGAFPQAVISGDIESTTTGVVAGGGVTPLPQLAQTVTLSDAEGTSIQADAETIALFQSAMTQADDDFEAAIEIIFNSFVGASKDNFYPFIARLFRCLGYDCEASRHGVNAQRWDAMIRDSEHSIPMEIKSPGEELFLSVKAVRQAVENKVVLTARESHPTTWETTSLAVGYHPPNARSDVTALISDVHYAYGITVGVVDFRSLLRLVGAEILLGKSHAREALKQLHGIIETQ